ncbi:MAG: type II toxin-antitoxin system VapC family toxin [Desulfobacteraceae bacterium]|nr:MAG: type II toxin-antitoxin system VapC family toxin [Desulfobacteraceae bacterium]
MKLILDTNGYAGFKMGNPEIVEFLTRANIILISPIVLGELMFGFINGVRFQQNMDELDQFINHEAVEEIQIGKITADRYSRIAAQLKRNGTPIPANDIWIAAQAMEYGAELVTMDRHFEKISGLVYRYFQLL